LLSEGSEFRVGRVRIQALHTPGHTPEHLCYVVTDTESADRPMGVFTGDFIFVGDVGRPDLLEKVAGVAGTMATSARALYASLQRFKQLPDWLQLWPGHGAGSACGRSLGAVPQSTLGYERLFNWGLAADSEAEFVAGVLRGQPEPPRYFAAMKRVNRDGPALLGRLEPPPRLTWEELDRSALLLDVRAWREFRRGHVPGSINIPLNRSFSSYAGSVIPSDRELQLVANGTADAAAAARRLAMIGLERVTGYLDREVLQQHAARSGLAELAEVDAATALELLRRDGALAVDVRGRSEWEELRPGGVGEFRHVPLGELPERAADLPGDRLLLVYCKSGSRSAVAASILSAAAGAGNILNVRGGLDAWSAMGGPVRRGGV
jgi:hydroxyacylglutathione hydrolase